MDVRTVTDNELPAWMRALNTGFLRPPVVTEQALAARRATLGDSRLTGAFEADTCVATFRSFPQEVTTPGGTPVPADAISNVTVLPTHRRRGLLTRLMADDLTAAKDRGDVVATLTAAEYRIYGRYGFGPATTMTEWTIDIPRAGFDPRHPVPLAGGGVDLIHGEEVRKLGPLLHERLRRTQPGAVSRHEHWWDMNTGVIHLHGEPDWTEPFYAVYRSADGEVDGLVSYQADENWTDAKQPQNTASVNWLLSVTPDASRALWHYLCSIDWIPPV